MVVDYFTASRTSTTRLAESVWKSAGVDHHQCRDDDPAAHICPVLAVSSRVTPAGCTYRGAALRSRPARDLDLRWILSWRRQPNHQRVLVAPSMRSARPFLTRRAFLEPALERGRAMLLGGLNRKIGDALTRRRPSTRLRCAAVRHARRADRSRGSDRARRRHCLATLTRSGTTWSCRLRCLLTVLDRPARLYTAKLEATA
jgi:hypothetical protein